VSRSKALDDPRLREGIEVKPSDSRSQGYVQQTAKRCSEADILPGEVIATALNNHVMSWIDRERWRKRDAEIKGARALL
jgi:hypothetical protein